MTETTTTLDYLPVPPRRNLLTRTQILEAEDAVSEYVEVPEWGGTVRVRSLEGLERDRYERSFVKIGAKGGGSLGVVDLTTDNARARLVSMTVVDEDGLNVFTEADILVLGHKSAAALERVASVAQRLSGLTDRDMEALKDGLGEAPSAGSGSASPVTSA
jgi:hypothetical protein